MKKYILTLLLLILSNPAHALGICQKHELQVDFIETNPTYNDTTHEAYIHGVLEMPTPGYIHSLVIESSYREGVLRGILTLRDTNPNGMKAQVITPIAIDQIFKIPVGTTHMEVLIEKNFAWGPNKYLGKISTFESTCLKPMEGEPIDAGLPTE